MIPFMQGKKTVFEKKYFLIDKVLRKILSESLVRMGWDMYYTSRGRIAQLVRVPVLHTGGPGFESLSAHPHFWFRLVLNQDYAELGALTLEVRTS